MARLNKRTRIGEGIYADKYGITARVKVAGFTPQEKRFPLDAELETIAAWRLRTRADLLDGAAQPERPRKGTLAGDVPGFLETIPDGEPRQQFAWLLGHWSTSELGAVPRAAITRPQVQKQIAKWETAGVAASTINHRVRALRKLYRVLDGEDAENPTTGIQKRREPRREPRSIPVDSVELILEQLPDRRHARKLSADLARRIQLEAKQPDANACELARKYDVSETLIRKIVRGAGRDVATWSQVAHTSIRLRVIAWTGIPHKQLERLRPQDVDLTSRKLFIRPRRKGKGAAGVWVDLIPPAVDALRAFADADLWQQKFSRSSMCQSWTRAITRTLKHLAATAPERLDVFAKSLPDRCHPYDLRHSFLTEFYRVTGDLRATAEVAQHANLETTKRYTEGAVSARVAAGVASFGARWQPPAPTPTPPAPRRSRELRLVRAAR